MTETSPATEVASAIPPAPRFVDESSRSEVVPLQWAIDYDGKTWTEITVRRPGTPEIEAWARRIDILRKAGADVTTVPVPIYDAPDAVINALDPDDDDRLTEVAQRFLPRRFQVAPGS